MSRNKPWCLWTFPWLSSMPASLQFSALSQHLFFSTLPTSPCLVSPGSFDTKLAKDTLAQEQCEVAINETNGNLYPARAYQYLGIDKKYHQISSIVLAISLTFM